MRAVPAGQRAPGKAGATRQPPALRSGDCRPWTAGAVQGAYCAQNRGFWACPGSLRLPGCSLDSAKSGLSALIAQDGGPSRLKCRNLPCNLPESAVQSFYETQKHNGRARRVATSPRPYAGDTTSHTAELLHLKSIITVFLLIIKGRFNGVCVASGGVGIIDPAPLLLSRRNACGGGNPPPRAAPPGNFRRL